MSGVEAGGPASGPFGAAAVRPGCVVSVAIPARDEAEDLGRVLRALAAQVDDSGRPLDRSRFEILVLANNCRDETAAVARRFAAREPDLALHVAEIEMPGPIAHVGTARRIAMDAACRRLVALGGGPRVVATTDADTRVDPAWIAATLRAIGRGAEVVGGHIRIDAAGRASLDGPAWSAYRLDLAYRARVARLESRLDPDPHDPWRRHHHHTGASLAVTTARYREVGGLPPLPTGEDVAIVRALARVDARIRHSPAVAVVTSARRAGRAAGGMADTLRGWSDPGRPLLVESVAAIEARLSFRRRLRRPWLEARDRAVPDAARLAALAERYGLDRGWLVDRLAEAGPFGALIEEVERVRPKREAPAAIVPMIAELDARLGRPRRRGIVVA